MSIFAALAEAARLHRDGDLIGARRKAEEALAAAPRDINALRLVGVLYSQMGEPGLGAAFLTRAVDKAPHDLPTRLNAMQALLSAGRAADADRLGQAAGPIASADLLKLRAAIARELGDSNRLVELLREAVRLVPQDYAGWNNLGNALRDSGEFEEAIEALEKARQINPGDSRVLGNLARALSSAGRAGDGIAALAEIVSRHPDDANAHWELAEALKQAGDNGGALRVIGRAAQLDQANPKIFTTMGVVFGNLNDLAQSEQAFRYALSVGPTYPPAYLNLGILLEQANRLDELRVLTKEMDRHGLRGDEMRFLAALLLRRDGKLDDALKLALATKAGESIDEHMRAHLVGQLADRLDKPQVAFDAFVAMHRATAKTAAARRFEGTEARREIETMARVVTPQWYAGWPSHTQPESSDAPASPAFLVGFLRSGTTLLDTMLMGHSVISVMEEEPILAMVSEDVPSLDAIAALDANAVAKLRARYFEEASKVIQPQPGKLVIDKNPLASLRSPLIHRLFPDARFIFALRHPCDVVLSCFMQNFKVNQAMASFLTLENAARYYDAVMRYWLQCQELLALNVHVVRYEALVSDCQAELQSLMDFLGLPWEDGLLSHEDTAADRGYIRTPSYAQVTEGIYERAKGRWERYRDQMEPVLPILAPWAERFGYDPI